MISREEIIELASNFKFRSKEYNLIEKLGDYYLIQPTLDSDVEEDLKTLEDWLFRKKSMYVPDGIAIVNKLRKALSDKNKRISDLNDTLEITVIAEMLDLIKNGKPIPLTRKELQSKLNAIEEVVNTLEILKDTTSPFEDNMYIMLTNHEYRKIKQIEQIIGDDKSE